MAVTARELPGTQAAKARDSHGERTMNDEFSFEAESPELFGQWESYGMNAELPRPGPLPPVPWGGVPGPSLGACAGLPRPVVIDDFDFDVDRLKPAHHAVLQRVAACIAGAARAGSPILTVRLVGHTDPVGSQAYNRGLGTRRASNARAALELALRRLDPTLPARIRFDVDTRGETEQRPGDRARSRRVEIFLPPVRPQRPTSRGCPPGYTSRLRIHVKFLAQPTVPFATSLAATQRLFRRAGILVEVASTENLSLPTLADLDDSCPGSPGTTCCPFPCATNNLHPEMHALFGHRNHAGANELVVYYVRSLGSGSNGCCAHPVGRPGVTVAQYATQWSLPHEIAHNLGLQHFETTGCTGAPTNRLMTGCGTNLINTPNPVLTPAELATMRRSSFLVPCGGRVSRWS
jgi:hypothetical protein